jgi:hypothetical protein
VQRKRGTARGSPRRSRTAKVTIGEAEELVGENQSNQSIYIFATQWHRLETGHAIPITLGRATYSLTAILPTPVASLTWRTLSPSSYVSRNTSRTFLIDTLLPAIGHTAPSSPIKKQNASRRN